MSGAAVSATRVLILSWEYPPIVEGGLARHVRKLSEQLVRDGVEVHVLTRGYGFACHASGSFLALAFGDVTLPSRTATA